MNIEDFDYDLPLDLIAQTPLKDRCSSRLLVLDKEKKTYEDKHFSDIVDYLNKGDAIVINDTKVLPARIYGTKEDTNAKIEVLLLKEMDDDVWEALAKPVKRLHIFTVLNFGDKLKGEVREILDDGIIRIKLIYDGSLLEILDDIGIMPLPPYIHEKLHDPDRYQTVYADKIGSAAAPTAGLHFTNDLLTKLEEKGVKIVHITLHVGLGTFRPVKEDDITKHKMHSEYYEISKEAADVLNETRKAGKKIYAVGTTSVRTLETVQCKYGTFKPCSGTTDIFIYPGYEFKGIDALITNFHLPKSTLIMLVSAFAGRDFVMEAYKHAVLNNYRFFSFGDAMLIK